MAPVLLAIRLLFSEVCVNDISDKLIVLGNNVLEPLDEQLFQFAAAHIQCSNHP